MAHNSKRPSLQMPRAEVEKRIRDRIDEGKKLLDFSIQNESDFQAAT